MNVSPKQIKLARILLDWTQPELAEHAGVSRETIINIEKHNHLPKHTVYQKIISLLIEKGVEFSDGDGVKKRTSQIYTLKGQKEFFRFFDDMYEEVKERKELYACNVDEELFDKWFGETSDDHTRRMEQINGLVCLTLVEEGKDYFPCKSYTEYKWVKQAHFEPSPFYVFGNKVAILLFEDDVTIIVIDHPDVAKAYRKQFLMAWEIAILPTQKES